MDWSHIYKNLKNKYPDIEIYENHPLAPYTTLKIGGPADIFIHTKTSEQFINILREVSNFDGQNGSKSHKDLPEGTENRKNLPTDFLTILGNGSNVLISDSGIRGVVIKNDSQEIEVLKNNQVKISSGTQLSYAINFSADLGLSGFEEFAYIPSTIGGAIFGNIHGDLKNNFLQFAKTIDVYNLKNSGIESLDASKYKSDPTLIVLSATFELNPGDPTIIKSTAQKIIERKSTNQLMNSAGCAFKNPEKFISFPIWNEAKSTGWIIDHELNLKGKSVGGAQISPLHANFLINAGNASAKDYLDLVDLIQTEVQKKFNFKFELEIKLLGDF